MKHDSWLIVYIIFWFILMCLGSARISYKHFRGNRLTYGLFGWRLWWALRHTKADPDAVQWGKRLLPGYVASQNFLVAGTVGSGKTLIVRLLLQKEMARKDASRFLVYDGKGDFLDILWGMNESGKRIVTFDPFLQEGARWNIARDVVDDASANQVARILFPKGEREHQPFFPESVQNLAGGIMQVFIELGITDWRLSHLLFILLSAERIQKVLNLTARGKDKIADFVHSGETWANIMATMANRIQDYEIVAALWEHAATEYSLREWAKSDAILVLRKTHTCSEVVGAMNQVLFAIGKRYLLSKPASTVERTWVILDELASFGGRSVSKELGLLLEQGRSRNICCLLGFQNISALRDEFGVHGADRLVGLCSTKALLRCESKESADWSCGFFGSQEVLVRSVSSNHSLETMSSTTSYDIKERQVVLASQFLSIPRTGKDYGLTGYFVTPVGKPPLSYKDHIDPKWLETTLTPGSTVKREERTGDQQRLAITEEDLSRLFQGRLPSAPQAQISASVPAESAPDPRPAPRPAEANPTPQKDAAPPSPPIRADKSKPTEIWDLASGRVEPAPSIWNVPRQ